MTCTFVIACPVSCCCQCACASRNLEIQFSEAPCVSWSDPLCARDRNTDFHFWSTCSKTALRRVGVTPKLRPKVCRRDHTDHFRAIEIYCCCVADVVHIPKLPCSDGNVSPSRFAISTSLRVHSEMKTDVARLRGSGYFDRPHCATKPTCFKS